MRARGTTRCEQDASSDQVPLAYTNFIISYRLPLALQDDLIAFAFPQLSPAREDEKLGITTSSKNCTCRQTWFSTMIRVGGS
jgi:hypothetical protein